MADEVYISQIAVGNQSYLVKDAGARAELANKAPLASPVFTGTPEAPTPDANDDSSKIANTAWVNDKIESAIATADAMIFKGTIGKAGATITTKTLPNDTAKIGWTYKAVDAGSYTVGTGTGTGTTTVTCEVGDMIIATSDGSASTYATWTVAQANIDGAVTGPASSTDAHVAIFNGTSGNEIKDSGYTIGKSVPSDAVFTDASVTSVSNPYTPTGTTTKSASGATGTSGTTVQVVTGVTTDAKGHVTAVTSGASTDTTYTAGTGLELSSGAFKHTNSVTAGNCKPSVNSSNQLVVGGVAYDSEGHVTSKETKTVKITTPTITVTPSSASTLTAVATAGTVPSWSASVESETLSFTFSAGAMPTFSSANRLTGISSASSTAPAFEVVTT